MKNKMTIEELEQMKRRTVSFLGEECSVQLGEYSNGRTSITLVCQDGEPMATATVNLPDVLLNPDEVCIKDYSENKGILAALQQAGIVSDVHETLTTGFTCVHVCFLLVKE